MLCRGTYAVWRRSDASALSKAVFITGADHKPIECQHVGVATTDAATFAFAPAPGGGEFFIYYMPLTTCEYEGGRYKLQVQVRASPICMGNGRQCFAGVESVFLINMAS